MGQPTYKFKFTNVDLKNYVADRRFVAQQKRKEAEVLIKQAEAIENEASELQMALIVVPEGQGGK